MPRNTTGGSGHRSQRNSEGSKARNNRCFIDDLLDDIKNNEKYCKYSTLQKKIVNIKKGVKQLSKTKIKR